MVRGRAFEDLLGRLDAVALGQLDVDDQDVGLELLDDVDDVAAVAGLADDLDDVRVGHPGLDRLADDLVVVAEDDPLCLAHAQCSSRPRFSQARRTDAKFWVA